MAQYELVLPDFLLSHQKKRQYLHNLVCGEALSYFYAEFEPLRNSYPDVFAKIESPFNSISKQQCAKAEVSGISFQDIVDKS